MKQFILSALFFIFLLSYSLQAQTTVTDEDGNIYPVIKINDQLWMGMNLKTTRFNDGTAIPLVTDGAKWKSLESPAFCWLNNDERNKEFFGALYNWYAVDTKKLCPNGWRVPSNADWHALSLFLGNPEFAGALLKEKGWEHWKNTLTEATDELGFTALPAGFRNSDGIFPIYAGNYTIWWSSTRYENEGCNRGLYFSNNILYQGHEHYRSGFSVRCIKEK